VNQPHHDEAAAPSAPHPENQALQHNTLRLSAVVVDMQSLRHTPAGIPALDFQVQHHSRQLVDPTDPAQGRQVALTLHAVAFGTVAQSLSQTALGSALELRGFLAQAAKSKRIVMHVMAFEKSQNAR
jgi:primosomal replication protein N